MTKYKRGTIKGTNVIMIAQKCRGNSQIEVRFQDSTTLERISRDILRLTEKDGKLTFNTKYGEFYI